MKIKELLFDVKEPTVYCESFVYEPSNIEEEKLGHLFMIGRIRNVPETSFYLINLLASRIKREYYYSSHRSPPQAFEKALKEGNQILKENESRIDWLGNLDFLVAGISQKKIYFTSLGKMRAFILRKEEVIDILGNSIPERDVLFPFSTILQGDIKKTDILIFSTANIFSKEKLINFGKEFFPTEEKKISKFIDSKESGVALLVETDKSAGTIERISQEREKEGIGKKLSHLTFSQKEKIFRKIIPRKEKFKEFFLKIKGLFRKPQALPSFKKEEIRPSITLKESYFFKPEINLLSFKKRIFRKEVVVSICILFLILAGFSVYQHQKNIENAILEEIIKAVETKKERGENALIYNDEEKALSYFNEGLEALNGIENPGDRKGEIESLKIEINEKIGEISGKKILSDITPLFEVKEGLEKFEPSGIIVLENNIYIFSSSPLIYKWDIIKKEGIYLEQEEKVLGGTMIAGKPFFILKPTAVVISEEEKILPLNFPYENVSITEVDSFENYFYIFDKNQGEILKYELKNTEVSSPILWFKERKAAKEAVSIAIDGSIYLLFPSGEIKRFSAGKLKEELPILKISPEIKEATKIFTSKNNKYLYLLEPVEKRVVVMDKKGNIVAEYQSEKFENLKDLWASPDDKFIYLLDGRKVFRIETKTK